VPAVINVEILFSVKQKSIWNSNYYLASKNLKSD